MALKSRRVLVTGAVAISAIFAGCHDVGPTIPTLVDAVTLSDSTSIFGSGGGSAPASEPRRVSYISMPPGIVPAGVSAEIRIRGTDFTITEALRDGTLDPTPIPASVGDTVELAVTTLANTTTRFVTVVPSKKKPTVIRTVPPKGKTDVPLNGAVKVVFSEPIDSRTVTTGTIELRHEGTIVTGHVTLEEGERLTAAFSPDVQLLPNARYRLVVSGAIRDLDGDPLARAITVDFTSGTELEPTGPVASVTVSPNPVTATPFQPVRFSAIARDAAGHILNNRVVTWESSNENIARVYVPGGDTVPINGLVFATGLGTATITAMSEGVSGTAEMTVVSASEEGPGDVASVSVPASVTLAAEDFLAIAATLRNAAGDEISRDVTWSSSNPAVVAVNPIGWGYGEDGYYQIWANPTAMQGMAEGTAVVTATSQGVSASAIVTVIPRRIAASVMIKPASATLLLQSVLPILSESRDVNGVKVSYRPVTWTSSNPSVVKVTSEPNSSPNISALSPGTAVITATTEGITASATITVPLLTFASVSAGHDDFYPNYMHGHTCAMTLAGATFCWGGDRGEPGDTWDHWTSAPVPLDGPALSSVSAGSWQSCGLDGEGRAYCWSNAITWTSFPRVASMELPLEVPGGLRYTAFDVGAYHMCGLVSGGGAYCTGYGEFGQLGDGSVASSNSPVAVSGNHVFVSMTAGHSHSCAVTGAGAAFCWGLNNQGQLGDGSTTTRSVPVPVSGGHNFIALSAGQTHTCGITSSGAAYCWGANHAGQLGDGSTTSRLVPTAVSGGLSFASLSAGLGAATTCGVTSAGVGYCWGDNSAGQLGNGSTGNSHVPSAVAGGLTFSSLSAGGRHTCGVTTSASIYCWGSNDAGQSGHNSGVTNVPLKVVGQP